MRKIQCLRGKGEWRTWMDWGDSHRLAYSHDSYWMSGRGYENVLLIWKANQYKKPSAKAGCHKRSRKTAWREGSPIKNETPRNRNEYTEKCHKYHSKKDKSAGVLTRTRESATVRLLDWLQWSSTRQYKDMSGGIVGDLDTPKCSLETAQGAISLLTQKKREKLPGWTGVHNRSGSEDTISFRQEKHSHHMPQSENEIKKQERGDTHEGRLAPFTPKRFTMMEKRS